MFNGCLPSVLRLRYLLVPLDPKDLQHIATPVQAPHFGFAFQHAAVKLPTSGQRSVLPPRWGIPFLSHAASLQSFGGHDHLTGPSGIQRVRLDRDRGTVGPRILQGLCSLMQGSCQVASCAKSGTKQLQRSLGFLETVGIRIWATTYDISRESWQWTKQAPESDRICLQRSSQVPHSKIHGSSQVVHVVPANTKLNDPNSSNPKECSPQSDRSFSVCLRICGRKGHNSRSRIHFIGVCQPKAPKKKYQRWFMISFPLPSGHLTYSLAMEKWPTSNSWNLATADGPMWSIKTCWICRDAQGSQEVGEIGGMGGTLPHISTYAMDARPKLWADLFLPVEFRIHKKHRWFLNNSWQQLPQGIAQKSPEKIRQMNQMNDILNHFYTQFSTNLHSTTKIDATLLYDRTQRKLDSDPTAPQLLNSGGTPDF